MKPDLHVTMNVDAIKNEGMLKLASGNSHTRKVFQGRLLDFFKAHHEGEVPEGTLPEPFNQSKLDLHTSTIKASSSSLIGEALTDALEEPQPAAASHLSQSFQKCFSKEVLRIEAVHSNPEQSLVSVQPSVPPVSELQVDHSSYDERISASTAPFISKFSNSVSLLGALHHYCFDGCEAWHGRAQGSF